MPTYKLRYFERKGRAELARLMFSLAEQKFEDERVKIESWPTVQPNTPYGQLPILVVDNTKQIHQSHAIYRYLARTLKLYGKDIDDEAECDMIMETINDVFTEMTKMFYEQDEQKQKDLCNTIKETSLPKFFNFLTNRLKENGGKCLVGAGLTIADLAFFDMMEKVTALPMFGEDVLKGYKELEELNTTVKTHPNIKKWLDERPKGDL